MELNNINKYIVITSINEPTTAVKTFSQLKDCQTLVVGDSKTPDIINTTSRHLPLGAIWIMTR